MAAKSSPPLEITQRQYSVLEGYIAKRSTPIHEIKRIKIILKASKGQSTYSISQQLGFCMNTITKWRKAWKRSYEELIVFEKGKLGDGVSDFELLKRMLSVVEDKKRPGSPPKFTMSQKKQIVALACRKPSDYNIPMSSWSHEMLAHVAVAEKIVESISRRTVGNILKKSGSKTA